MLARCACKGAWASVIAVSVASICCRIGSGAFAACADARLLLQSFCNSASRFNESCSLVACSVSAFSQPVACSCALCHCCCSFCNVSRVGSASKLFVVAANCASNFSLNSESVLAMFSICALGFAPAVRLPIRLDTAVAHVAISASGIVAGAAGADSARGFADSVFSGSAAPTEIGGSEQATSPAISEEQINDRSDPRALSRAGGISFTSEKTHPRLIRSMERKTQRRCKSGTLAGLLRLRFHLHSNACGKIDRTDRACILDLGPIGEVSDRNRVKQICTSRSGNAKTLEAS